MLSSQISKGELSAGFCNKKKKSWKCVLADSQPGAPLVQSALSLSLLLSGSWCFRESALGRAGAGLARVQEAEAIGSELSGSRRGRGGGAARRGGVSLSVPAAAGGGFPTL